MSNKKRFSFDAIFLLTMLRILCPSLLIILDLIIKLSTAL